MRILLVGGGGREHALAWKLRQSQLCNALYAAPGNAGIAQLAECVPIAASAIADLVQFARQNAIDLVVVGPESPLIAGLADALQEAGIPCFGPARAAAQLEGSKAFAKQLMAEVGAPTAPFAVFDDADSARAYLRERFLQRPCVVKADGEALGKGVFVCDTLGDALDAVEFLMEHRGLGEAGARVVIEDRLHGREMSLLCLTDGERALPMPPCARLQTRLRRRPRSQHGRDGLLHPPARRDACPRGDRPRAKLCAP
jgi:phosphoribosylamine--glycine ligase